MARLRQNKAPVSNLLVLFGNSMDDKSCLLHQ